MLTSLDERDLDAHRRRRQRARPGHAPGRARADRRARRHRLLGPRGRRGAQAVEGRLLRRPRAAAATGRTATRSAWSPRARRATMVPACWSSAARSAAPTTRWRPRGRSRRRSEDPLDSAANRTRCAPCPNTEIKICGLSHARSGRHRGGARATHIGLVHYPPSPRHVTLEQGAALRARVPAAGPRCVLLLVNEQPQPTAQAIQAVRARRGPVPRQRDARVARAAAAEHPARDLEGDRRQRHATTSSARSATRARRTGCSYDAPAKKLPGGTGLAFDWSLLTASGTTMPWGLAGGLTPENVAEAIRAHRAPNWSTSLRASRAHPGVKDVDKIAAFCQAAREHDRATQLLPRPARRARPFRPVRRPLRRRDADAADPRARTRISRGQGRSCVQGRVRRPARALCRPAEPAVLRPAADRARDARRRARSGSSATSSTTPARTRSTTASARSCWRCAWARRGSSPRPARASTASPPPPSARASACRA